MKLNWLIKVLLVSLLNILSGCNSLFYFPQREIVYRPTDFNLKFSEQQIETADHETLKAWILPAKENPQGIVVLQFHGNAENRSTHFFSAAWLVMHGVDVVIFDYRGYDGSSGEPSRNGLVTDGEAVFAWLSKHFPSHKKFILAQSLGGAVAIAALAKPGMQEHFSGLILESTFHSYRGIARMKMASSWLFWLFQWMPYVLLTGDANPIDAAPSIHLPVLAFHAKQDTVVEFDSGKILYDELAKTTKVQFYPIEGNKHVGAFADPEGFGREKMLKFLGVVGSK